MGNNTSINEGPIICNTFDTKASFEDLFSCFVFQIPYKLDEIKLGYINFVLLLIIILISFFGTIKLNYRWFIVNMCLIDLFTCWDFICEKGFYQSSANVKCYYFEYLEEMFRYQTFMFLRMPCIGLFILTGSRFLNLYFSNAYKKFEKTWKIILVIFIIDFAYILISIGSISLFSKYNSETTKKCLPWITNYPDFIYKNLTCNHKSPEIEPQCLAIAQDFFYSCDKEAKDSWNWAYILTKIYPCLAPLALIFSTVFVVFLIVKVAKQLKFSATINQSMLKTNIRIVIVFSVQTILLIFIFLIDAVGIVQEAFNPDFKRSFPMWLKWLTYQHGTVASLREIRIFIDSLIILAFMSGYREDLIAVVFFVFRSSKKTLKKTNEKIFTTKTTVVSLI